MLRAITFDLWETLIHEDPDLENARRDYRIAESRRILAAHGLNIDVEAFEIAHQSVIARMHSFWGSNLDSSVIEQVKMFLEAAAGTSLEKKLPPTALLEAAKFYGEAALKFPPSAAEGALDVVRNAQSRGLHLALICNTGRTPGKVLRELLHRMGLRDYFDGLYFSDEIRIRKPAREIFEKALLRVGVEPRDAMHVGDRLETDIVGAAAAGMATCHLDNGGHPATGQDRPTYTISDLRELPAILDTIASAPGHQTRSVRRNLGETRHD